MQQRDISLDALRGLAILAMVLSSSIAFGILPAWMYHAQEPPPAHTFMPGLPGITWVDLVFPFFLFSMGAAIPLALHRKAKDGAGLLSILLIAARRYALLAFFALFTWHARYIALTADVKPATYLLQAAAFVLLCFQLYRPAGPQHKTTWTIIKAAAFLLAAGMLYLLPFKGGQGFSLYNSDIILLVLANMAFFGTIAWWCTRRHPVWRLGILPFVMAVLLAAKEPGSWTADLFQWSPLPWLYKFYYLKYLFILLPGTLAGEWLLQHNAATGAAAENAASARTGRIAVLAFAVIVTNVICLFGRHLLGNLALSVVFCWGLYLEIRKVAHPRGALLLRFLQAGAYLLLLGLFFEGYEGGIKKDPSTFSYYLVTGGLAFFMLTAFYCWQLTGAGAAILRYLGLNGRNPMVAYVSGNLLLLPLLRLSGGMTLYSDMQRHVITGFLSGVLFTAMVSGVTVFFTKRGWMWKT
ncbi:DUF5009 domain-containing protein [Chitinophaga japonensis]|uniref:Uncharacterized protein DUF5009 n=1 Tax=Chitinophaga japonensis TaxID=104662 RepID=A0A562TFS1_CHIJA|nr:DUF5009 domain-containing protein [Chitinophaga japonensis]TWI92389.1 uncharacterized protein DUF5009 [Chitinophaga japonensis]